ncbi:unnamed protein product [Acanthosepion pharaonis]|uniref:Uncharacterized protein n=1 Tax=Acanthosepion pharaonis TaxID=158019 RepID=A0A812B852_ACAPH|nr:unnamed protein product [Sepia pharaonis]
MFPPLSVPTISTTLRTAAAAVENTSPSPCKTPPFTTPNISIPPTTSHFSSSFFRYILSSISPPIFVPLHIHFVKDFLLLSPPLSVFNIYILIFFFWLHFFSLYSYLYLSLTLYLLLPTFPLFLENVTMPLPFSLSPAQSPPLTSPPLERLPLSQVYLLLPLRPPTICVLTVFVERKCRCYPRIVFISEI